MPTRRRFPRANVAQENLEQTCTLKRRPRGSERSQTPNPRRPTLIFCIDILEWTRPFHGRVHRKELEDLSEQIRTSFEKILELACERMLLETCPPLKLFEFIGQYQIFSCHICVWKSWLVVSTGICMHDHY